MVALLRVPAITSERGSLVVDHCSGERVTKNCYDRGARNRKRLWCRIIGLWRLANDFLLLKENGLSGENG